MKTVHQPSVDVKNTDDEKKKKKKKKKKRYENDLIVTCGHFLSKIRRLKLWEYERIILILFYCYFRQLR